MRVIAGKCRSLPLKTVPGRQTRPTTDRIKETLFNMLQPYLPDARFLDLFAGSGAIGIEALSRGAASVAFVDRSARSLQSCSRLYPAEFKIYEAGTAGSAPAHGSACSSAVASGTGAF